MIPLIFLHTFNFRAISKQILQRFPNKFGETFLESHTIEMPFHFIVWKSLKNNLKIKLKVQKYFTTRRALEKVKQPKTEHLEDSGIYTTFYLKSTNTE